MSPVALQRGVPGVERDGVVVVHVARIVVVDVEAAVRAPVVELETKAMRRFAKISQSWRRRLVVTLSVITHKNLRMDLRFKLYPVDQRSRIPGDVLVPLHGRVVHAAEAELGREREVPGVEVGELDPEHRVRAAHRHLLPLDPRRRQPPHEPLPPPLGRCVLGLLAGVRGVADREGLQHFFPILSTGLVVYNTIPLVSLQHIYKMTNELYLYQEQRSR